MPKVLLVDDEYMHAAAAVRALANQAKAHGMDLQVETARDGKEALWKLRAGTFDAVVTDYEMGASNGVELAAELRKVPGYDRTPVILRSGLPWEDIKSRHPHTIDALGISYCGKMEPEAKLFEVFASALERSGERGVSA